MPQVIPLATVIIAQAAGLGAFATMALGFASSIVAGFLASAMQDSQSSTLEQGYLINVRDTQSPVPMIYGQMRVGGCQVYVGATNGNRLLHIIQTIGEGEIDSVVETYLGDKLYTDFGGDAFVEVKTGTNLQAACGLAAYDSNFSDPMRYTAYLYVRLQFNTAKFQSLPLITALVKGLKVYDPRSEETAWSDNPALCMYDFHGKSRYGAGLGSFWSDLSSVIDCANWCDEKGYKLNCAITSQEAAMDIQERLLAGFRTRVVWSGYNFKLLPLDWDAPVMAITEDDVREGSWRIVIPSAQNIPNMLQVTYPNAENKYTAETFPIHDATAINLDGEQHDAQLQLPGVTSKDLAVKMGNYAIKRMRMDRMHSFVGGPKCLGLEAGDLVTVTHSTPGFSAAVVRVHSANPLPNDEVAISIQEEDDELYNDDISVVSHVDYTTTLPNPLDQAPPPAGVSFSEEIYTIKDYSFARIKCVFSASSPYMEYAEVWISRDDVSYDFLSKAVDSFVIGPVRDDEVWYVKLVPVSVHGIKPALQDVASYSYRVTGKTASPDDVSNFRASVVGDTVVLRWDGADETDLSGYELRYGTPGVSDWAAALFFSFYRTESVNLVGIKPGAHAFFIKAKNTLGVYSVHAASVAVTVFDPPNYSEKHSFTTDFNEGTHDNTEYFDHPVHGRILRVTHAGGLEGAWTSPVCDLGSILTRRWWALYDIAYNFADGTWSEIFAGRTWAQVFDGGLTWRQVFGDPTAGRLEMEFFYSEDGLLWNSTRDFHILASEVSARYVYYTVSIADATDESWIYIKPITLKGYFWA